MLRTHLVARIQRYLNNEISRQALGEWLLSNLQNILDSGDERTITLANHIDADLVELSEDIIEDSLFRQRLEHYLASQTPSDINCFQIVSRVDSETNVIFSPLGIRDVGVRIHSGQVIVV